MPAAATAELDRIRGRAVARPVEVPPPAAVPPPDPAPAAEPDAEHSLADWARIEGGPVPPAPDRPRPTVLPPAAEPKSTPRGILDPGAAQWLLALVLLSAVPLTLSRLLVVESSNGYTADGYFESTVPWTLAVVVPLALAAVLLVLRSVVPRALPAAFGLVLGAALVLTETSLFWMALLVEEHEDGYVAGPGLWSLLLGWVVVGAAAVLVLLRTPLAGRRPPAKDWRILCALLVLACTAVAIATVSEDSSFWAWIMNSVGLVLLGLAALAVIMLRLEFRQAVAGLVAIGVLSVWILYFLIADYQQQYSGIDPSERLAQIVCVLLVIAACGLAQIGRLGSSVPTSEVPASR